MLSIVASMATNPLDVAYWLIAVGCCTFAIIKGAPFTRGAGAIWLVLLPVTLALGIWLGNAAMLNFVAATGIAILAYLGWGALRGGAIWTLFATAFQLMSLITTLVVTLTPVSPLVQATVIRVWDYGFLAALAIGAWGDARARGSASNTRRASA